MINRIGNDAIKISLIQTLSGKEFDVSEKLKAACLSKGLTKFAILKGFGAYDIVFIYAWVDFSSILTEAGSIDGIIKTSRSFCYHHHNGSSDDLFLSINKNLFSSITMIKMADNIGYCNFDSERLIIEKLDSFASKIKRNYLGTLGWSELVTISCGDDINLILEACLQPSYTSASEHIKKTYSLLCINHNAIQDYNNLDEVPCLKTKVGLHIMPTISITCLPGATAEIISHWRNDTYKVLDIVGKDDIQITLIKEVEWAVFITDLLNFREKYKDMIQSTSTSISFGWPNNRDTIVSKQNDISLFDYDYLKLQDLFQDKAKLLAGTLNTLRGLIQNRIVNDAFIDMAEYPLYLIKFAEVVPSNKKTIFALQVTDLINKAAELRLYGTHGTIEENVGQFNKLRGGVQRSLQAISYIPRTILSRTIGELGYKWQGFTALSNHQFFNCNEVIHVPEDSLWSPQNWWAINHETAHIIINNIVYDNGRGIIDDNNLELKMFLSSKNTPDHWLEFVKELAAEYIGYDLAFYGKYELYLEKVWTYLGKLTENRQLYSPLSVYSIRTYFVGLFERRFHSKEIDNKYIGDFDSIYEEIASHIDGIRQILKVNNEQTDRLFNDKFVIAAYYAPKFKSLLPWLENILNPAVKQIKCRRDKRELFDSNTNEVMASLESGMVWEPEIKFPEAVLYKVYEKGDLQFSMAIATVLTFWNLYKKAVTR